MLNVYGNGNEGDMSAGLDRTGPAGSDEVGRLEAAAMLQAWRRAGRAGLSRRPALDLRWTRVCFCGQTTETGPVADDPAPGPAVLHRLGGGARAAVRRHRAALRGHPQPGRIRPTRGTRCGVTGARAESSRTSSRCWTCACGDKLIATLPRRADRGDRPRLRAKVLQAVGGLRRAATWSSRG